MIYHMPPGDQAVQLTQALNPTINSDFMVEGEVVRFASYDGLQSQALFINRERHPQKSCARFGVGARRAWWSK